MKSQSGKLKSWAGIVLLVLVLLPLLYLLGIGPMTWLRSRGYISFEAWNFTYGSFVESIYFYEPTRAIFLWYTELFIGPRFEN